jgi:DNA-binding Lrp family transcriptional regulator
MITGLVLVRLVSGREKQALQEIKKINGVTEVTACFGSWDAIAKVEAEELETIASVVVGKIRLVSGVANTETLIEVKI